MKPIIEPTYPAILHFTSANEDGREYIVIATAGPVKDHAVPGFEFYRAVEIDDESCLPTDTPLWKHD